MSFDTVGSSVSLTACSGRRFSGHVSCGVYSMRAARITAWSSCTTKRSVLQRCPGPSSSAQVRAIAIPFPPDPLALTGGSEALLPTATRDETTPSTVRRPSANLQSPPRRSRFVRYRQVSPPAGTHSLESLSTTQLRHRPAFPLTCMLILRHRSRFPHLLTP